MSGGDVSPTSSCVSEPQSAASAQKPGPWGCDPLWMTRCLSVLISPLKDLDPVWGQMSGALCQDCCCVNRHKSHFGLLPFWTGSRAACWALEPLSKVSEVNLEWTNWKHIVWTDMWNSDTLMFYTRCYRWREAQSGAVQCPAETSTHLF